MTRRPVLAPGLLPLRHPSGQLQIGLAAEHRLRLPDAPHLKRALGLLERGEALPDTAEARRARSLLAPVLRDGDLLLRPGMDPAEVAAVALRHPSSATARLDARSRTRVEVRGDLGPDVASLLGRLGLAPYDGTGRPGVVLLLSRGEPDREELDRLVTDGTPHLVVRAVESTITVGPFVLPGETPCLRCGDLQRATADPAYPLLLTSALHGARTDGVVAPVDLALGWVALGWAAQDLVRFAEHDRPRTCAATLTLAADLGPGDPVPLDPHPDCSCTWATPRPR